MLNQTETAVVHYISHHCITPHGGQNESLWREKALLRAQYGTLHFKYNTKAKKKNKKERNQVRKVFRKL